MSKVSVRTDHVNYAAVEQMLCGTLCLKKWRSEQYTLIEASWGFLLCTVIQEYKLNLSHTYFFVL